MKKRVIFFIIILIIVAIFIISVVNKSLIKDDKDLKGELPESRQVSLTVVPFSPILTIISPEERTYPSTSIFLNYTVKYEDTVWYNLDNTENITITVPLLFTASEGSHTLYLYANNTRGTSVKNVSFSIDLIEQPSPLGGNGGNGGGGITKPKEENETCQQSWFCESWSTCMDNLQNRTCTDINYCKEPYTRIETITCPEEKPKEPKIMKKIYWWLWPLIILAVLLILLVIRYIMKKLREHDKKGKKTKKISEKKPVKFSKEMKRKIQEAEEKGKGTIKFSKEMKRKIQEAEEKRAS